MSGIGGLFGQAAGAGAVEGTPGRAESDPAAGAAGAGAAGAGAAGAAGAATAEPTADPTGASAAREPVAQGVGSLSNQFTAAAMAALLGKGAAGRAGATGDAARVADLRRAAADELRSFATSDPAGFAAVLRQAFGAKLDDAALAEIVRRAAIGDLPAPEVQLVSRETLGDADAAYGDGKIFMSRELLQTNPAAARLAYLEELGHHLDARLGGPDAEGDEGQLFAEGVHGRGPLALAAAEQARASRDQGTILVDGREVAVEFRRNLGSGEASDAADRFIEQTSRGTFDWVISEANAKNAADAITDLDVQHQRNLALVHILKDHPEHFERMVANHAMSGWDAATMLRWFADPDASPALKRAFMETVEGPTFTRLLEGLDKLDTDIRDEVMKEVIDAFGPERWSAKLILEGARARQNGDDGALSTLSTTVAVTKNVLAVAGWLGGASPPVVGTFLGIYADAFAAVDRGMAGLIMKALEEPTLQPIDVQGLQKLREMGFDLSASQLVRLGQVLRQ